MLTGDELDPGPTAQLANFVVGWRPPSIQHGILRETKRTLIDILGVALAGSQETSSRIMAQVARQQGAPGPAAVIGQGFRSASLFAALANGTTAHSLDYDDFGKVGYTGHPTVCIVPAALAAAEEMNATGRELIEAMIVGFEVVTRIGSFAGGPDGEAYRRGFHGTSLYGIFGATAASSRLFGLDAEQTCRAFGISASGPKGIRANYGTDTKPLHAGEANRTGLLAALLARDGFTANCDVIEARFGWADAVAGSSKGSEQLAVSLGTEIAIGQGVTNFKRYPACGTSHPTIRAVLRLMSESKLQPQDVAEIEILIAKSTITETLVYPWPSCGLEGKFSLAYNVAAAWTDGRVAINTFTDAKVRELEPYRSRIKIGDRDSVASVAVIIRTNSGSEFHTEEPTGRVDEQSDEDVSIEGFRKPSGGHVPMVTDDELQDKFFNNVTEVRSHDQAVALLAQLQDIETASSVHEMTELLL